MPCSRSRWHPYLKTALDGFANGDFVWVLGMHYQTPLLVVAIDQLVIARPTVMYQQNMQSTIAVMEASIR
jgi:hypothetical protein